MSCPDHPQWYHDREDCPFCVAIEIRAEQQKRAEQKDAAAVVCRNFRPDHNGECLNCDEPLTEHTPDALRGGLLLTMARDWIDPMVVRDAPERAADVIAQLVSEIERLTQP